MRFPTAFAFRATAAVIVLSACAPAAQVLYVAPTVETIVSGSEVRTDGSRAILIYVENHSTVPIVVLATRLLECDNIKQQCATRPSNIRIRPGQRFTVLRLDPANPTLGLSYRFGYSWRADSADITAYRLLADARGDGSQLKLASVEGAQTVPRSADLPREETVAETPDPNAPIFQGFLLDADTRTPLGCASVALEDSAQIVVAHDRSTRGGMFGLVAPKPGSYRVRIETAGWAPAYGPAEVVAAGDFREERLLVSFLDQALTSSTSSSRDHDRHAAPVSISPMPDASTMASSVELGEEQATPLLRIVGSTPRAHTWAQFVVDSTGRVDTASVQLPKETTKAVAASVRSVLPRVHFSPALAAGKPVCELQRMEVNFQKASER